MADKNEDFEEYQPRIVDLDGEKFEVIDAICYDDQNYVALVPYTEPDELEEDDVEFIVLKEVEQDGEYMLSTVDDEELYDEVGQAFIEHLKAIYGDEVCADDCECGHCQ